MKTHKTRTGARRIRPNEVPAGKLVIIPYVRPVGTPDSLAMAIRGWRMFCKEPVRLVVLGDRPECAGAFPDVSFVPAEQGDNPHVSVSRSLMAYLPAVGDDCFYLTADDIVPVSAFSLDQLDSAPLSARQLLLEPAAGNYYIADMVRTKSELEARGIEFRNYSVHVPHRYDRRMYLKMCEDFRLDSVALDPETLYYCVSGAQSAGACDERQGTLAHTVLPFDDIRELRGKLRNVVFINFGGSLTDRRYYDLISDYLDETADTDS